MSASAFLFIITGVILNAAAQLLLKAGTNALGGAKVIPPQRMLAMGVIMLGVVLLARS